MSLRPRTGAWDDDVIIPPSFTDKEAIAQFPKGWHALKHYLRLVPAGVIHCFSVNPSMAPFRFSSHWYSSMFSSGCHVDVTVCLKGVA